jgi:S-DNA-T family DNA segregation ATPase FtsK/SpoIIIE
MSLWEKMKARKQLVKAFRTAEIYKTYSTDNGDRYILPKIHSVSITDQSTQYVFTLPTGVNPDLLKKHFYVFLQVFGQQTKLEGEVKKVCINH